MTEPPVCECHGEPCYWNPDKGMRAGGMWRCRIKRNEQDRARDPRRRRQRQLAYWHRADGGYIVRRKRDLARQREQIVNQLAQLEREADYRA